MRLPAALLLIATQAASPAWAKVPVVETDIPPVAALVAQVLGDLGQPGLLLDKGGDEHDLQLRPSQMRDLSATDLLVWVGPELTPGLATAAASVPGLQSLALLDDPSTKREDYAEGGLNPHAWLDPDNAATWLGLIAERLAALDPEHAATFRANAIAAKARLAEMDSTMATDLAALTQPFVTYHDAYGYFARHYRLPYLGGLAAGDAAPPGAARLSDLHQLAASGGIACVFPEAQHDAAEIASLAASGSDIYEGPALDPVGSTLDPGPEAYGLLMRNLANALLTCPANNP